MTQDEILNHFKNHERNFAHSYKIADGTLTHLLTQMEGEMYTYEAQMLFKKLHYDINFGYTVYARKPNDLATVYARLIALQLKSDGVYAVFDKSIHDNLKVKELSVRMALHLHDTEADYNFVDEKVEFTDERLSHRLDSFYIDAVEVEFDE
jgi:hypothetical protein